MPDNPVPPEVRLFIFDCIESVAHLEALLLLKDTPEQDWDVSRLARRLYIGHAEATAILEHLTACELAQRSGAGFRYHTRDAERRRLIDALAESHARYLVPLTRLIHEKASGIRKFADAFKFRKDT
ncbi:MAG TPA: hypothetical protein VEV64_03055 [Rhizomicrobium sp.]|jgi:hypothetical protein|nr:hypothetical protein [Rhizomicrobium sp.]